MKMNTQTSLFAFKVWPEVKQATLRGRILSLLQAHEPMTNKEISMMLQKDINVITPRVCELREMDYLIEAGRRPDRYTGMQCMTWKLSPVYVQQKAEA